jgi:hypothetical protein
MTEPTLLHICWVTEDTFVGLLQIHLMGDICWVCESLLVACMRLPLARRLDHEYRSVHVRSFFGEWLLASFVFPLCGLVLLVLSFSLLA